MKRSILILSGVLVLGLALVFGGYWFYGTATEAGIREYFAGENPLEGANLKLESYQKGFFKSRATSSISIAGEEDQVHLVNEIFHGPVAFTPDGMKFGSGYVITRLDLESLPDEAKQRVSEYYAGKDPLTVRTAVSFGGGRTSQLTLAAVDHDADGTQIRFGGGSGNLSFSADQSDIDGQMTIEPLTFRTQDEDESLRLRTSRMAFSVKSSGQGMRMEASMGESTATIAGDSGGSFELGGLQFKSEFAKAGGESLLMLGGGSFSIPSAKFSITSPENGGETGGMELKDLNIVLKTSQSGEHVTTGAEYSAGGLVADFSVLEKPTPYLDLLADGARMSASTTLPRGVFEEFAGFQKKLTASGAKGDSLTSSEMTPEQLRELAQMVENASRKINAGSGLRLEVGAGKPDSGAKVSIEVTYRGERPLTTQKTYIDVIEASEVRVESRVPKAFFQDNAEVMEQVQGMIAMGAVKEDGANFASTLLLKGAELSANGEPLPLLENFLPILSEEIPWDAFFAGMREAAAAGAAIVPEPTEEPKPDGVGN